MSVTKNAKLTYMKQMNSLTELYRIGFGPSSSHTIGIGTSADVFRAKYPSADRFDVTLYESLALTGIGHGTDNVIRQSMHPIKTNIIFDEQTKTPHPNTLDYVAYNGNEILGKARFFSVGGGAIEQEGVQNPPSTANYKHSRFTDIKEYCKQNNLRLWQYVVECEGEQILEYLKTVWTVMKKSVENGIKATGALPGVLQLGREANNLYSYKNKSENPAARENRIVSAYAFAVAEENAGGGKIVTAPTCGACGVLPAVLYYMQKGHNEEKIIHALATAGLIGNLIKTNASISGAEAGCQAEIGSACSMAAAALGELFELNLNRIEIAAEIAMEHFLGLTCDPVAGLVQIPCIERNAAAAMRAINAVRMAETLSENRKIPFDLVVDVMYETGKDLQAAYRETSQGGLAKLFKVGE